MHQQDLLVAFQFAREQLTHQHQALSQELLQRQQAGQQQGQQQRQPSPSADHNGVDAQVRDPPLPPPLPIMGHEV